MDRHLARTNPRLYAARWLSVDEEGHSALLRSLPPEELALHVDALLAALVQPPAVVGEGRLNIDVRVEGLDAVGLSAYHQVESGPSERKRSSEGRHSREPKRYRILDASGLRPAEGRAVLEALWAANARLGGTPPRTAVSQVSLAGLWGDDDPYHQPDPVAFELRLLDRQLVVLEALHAGLPLRRAELQAYEATYTWWLERPDGGSLPDYSQPGPGHATLNLFWAAPHGVESEAFFSSGHSNASFEAFVEWSAKTVRARGCPLWQRWQDPRSPSVLELPPDGLMPSA